MTMHLKRSVPEYVIVDRLRMLVDEGVDIDRLPGYLTISQLLLMSIDQLKAAEVCCHERLDMDGICRSCGADKRSLG